MSGHDEDRDKYSRWSFRGKTEKCAQATRTTALFMRLVAKGRSVATMMAFQRSTADGYAPDLGTDGYVAMVAAIDKPMDTTGGDVDGAILQICVVLTARGLVGGVFPLLRRGR